METGKIIIPSLEFSQEIQQLCLDLKEREKKSF